MSFQIEMINLEDLVPEDHSYRKLLNLINFYHLTTPLRRLEKNQDIGCPGYGIESLFKCLLLQFMEDLSDRERDRFLQENNAGKYFCGFELSARTPHYSLFSQIRKKVGPSKLSKLFNKVRSSLKKQGVMSEVFTFVDASHLISKANLWEEKDKLIGKKIEKLNNETLPKVAQDKQARIGCKGKNKFWYGYKRHVSVDMQSGLINKVAITPANVTDAKAFVHICPSSGAVFGDKGFCTQDAVISILAKGCHNATIKKNNMKGKNKDRDRWYSGIRSPYERVFSKVSHRARYQGVAKNQFQGIMQAFAFNLKRLLVLEVKKIEISLV